MTHAATTLTWAARLTDERLHQALRDTEQQLWLVGWLILKGRISQDDLRLRRLEADYAKLIAVYLSRQIP